MEPLWSPAGATGGKNSAMFRKINSRSQGNAIATDCHKLRTQFHGKTQVDLALRTNEWHPPPRSGEGRFLSSARREKGVVRKPDAELRVFVELPLWLET